jgi:hypothetical protein
MKNRECTITCTAIKFWLKKINTLKKSNILFASLTWNNYENCMYHKCFLFSVPCVCWFRFGLFKTSLFSSTAVMAASCLDVCLEADWSSNSIHPSSSDGFWDNGIFFPLISIYLFSPHSPPFLFSSFFFFPSSSVVLLSVSATVSTLPGFRDN